MIGSDREITIGITTYNRRFELEKMADSLHASDLFLTVHIRIYDDASTEYDTDFLQELFPEAITIIRQNTNLGADGNIRFMYEDFLKTNDELLFNADSDLIFRSDWLHVLMDTIDFTSGILGGFNAPNHAGISETSIQGYQLLIKQTIGSAGVLFTRRAVEQIESAMRDETSAQFDWKWADMFSRKNIPIYVLRDSVVQHIGISGNNSGFGSFDFGTGFVIEGEKNGQILNDVLYSLSRRNTVIKREPSTRHTISLFPFSDVPKGSRVVIYGAGKYGQDYIKQIRLINYCKIEAIVDENRSGENIIRSEQLNNYDFDYVIIAVSKWKDVCDIRENLKRLGIKENKIIYNAYDRRIEI